MIGLKTAWIGVKLEPDVLIFQEHMTRDFEGFCSLLDTKGETYREKKLIKFLKADPHFPRTIEDMNEKELKKFGQVRPWPIQFRWKFPWDGPKSKSSTDLKEYIKRPPTISFLNLPSKIRDGIVEHLVVELFFYFRRSVPSRYLDRIIEKLMIG